MSLQYYTISVQSQYNAGHSLSGKMQLSCVLCSLDYSNHNLSQTVVFLTATKVMGKHGFSLLRKIQKN